MIEAQRIVQGCSRRQILKAGLAASLATISPIIARASEASSRALNSYSATAVDLVQQNLVMDMLSLFSFEKIIKVSMAGGSPFSFNHDELEQVKRSGVNVFHPAFTFGGPNVFEGTEAFFEELNRVTDDADSHFAAIDSVSTLDALVGSGKTGILYGMQNSEHFHEISDVQHFYAMGQRLSQLTYNTANRIGSGAMTPEDEGLTDFGVSVVSAMNDVGMAVDVSHCGDRTTLDVFEASDKPVLITHSNCRSLVPGHPRCKPDEAIKAMAKSGGVMGITTMRHFVSGQEPTTLDHVLDHFDYVADLVGVEHVGIGSDGDLVGYDNLPSNFFNMLKGSSTGPHAPRAKMDIDGLDAATRSYAIADGLLKRGYPKEAVVGVLGGNFRRVLAQIWASK